MIFFLLIRYSIRNLNRNNMQLPSCARIDPYKVSLENEISYSVFQTIVK